LDIIDALFIGYHRCPVHSGGECVIADLRYPFLRGDASVTLNEELIQRMI
jgi:hypothetical protein